MKTKKILVVAVLTAFMSMNQLAAQNTNTTTRQNRADINELIDKRCHRMENQLKLDEATAAKFTPLYKEYLKEMRACRPTHCTKAEKKQCTDAEKKACMEKRFECREKMLNTQKKYFKKFETFLTADQLRMVFGPKRYKGAKCDKAHRYHQQCKQNGNRRHASCDQHRHNGDCHTN